MIKLIPVTRLQAGMYVHDLNCGWLQHGFVRNRFLVASADDVRKVREIGVTEIYVDTGRGLDPDASEFVVEAEALDSARLRDALNQYDVILRF